MEEHWKTIEGYDNYEVSDFGRICNTRTGVYLEGSTRSQGYRSVGLSKKGKTKSFFVHRLVAAAFIPNPEKKEIVKHYDHINDNNIEANLYWQSFEEIRILNGHMEPAKVYINGILQIEMENTAAIYKEIEAIINA
jgi:hypothetical protein